MFKFMSVTDDQGRKLWINPTRVVQMYPHEQSKSHVDRNVYKGTYLGECEGDIREFYVPWGSLKNFAD